MKCVKNLATNEIKRVSDSIADTYVNTGKFKFIPKSEWKAATRVVQVSNEVVEPSVKVTKTPGRKNKQVKY